MSSPSPTEARANSPDVNKDVDASDRADHSARIGTELTGSVIPLALIILITLATLWPLLKCDFVTRDDDYTVSKNPLLKPPSLRGVLRYWTWPAWGLYTPVTYTVWSGVALLSPPPALPGQPYALNPATFHAANLLVHVLSVIVVWLIVRRCGFDPWIAACAALVFAIHPVQVETVAWVSGLKDLLAGFFALLATWQYIEAVAPSAGATVGGVIDNRSANAETEDGRSVDWRNWHYTLCIIAALLGMLSKASAGVVPAICFAIDWLILRRSFRAIVRSVLPVLLCCLPFIIAAGIIQRPQHQLAFWQRPILALYTITFYVSKVVWPVALAPDYARPPRIAIQHPWIWASWIVPLLLALLGWFARRRSPAITLAVIIFVLGFFPVIGFFPTIYQGESTVSDHYLYVSMLGVAIACAALLDKRIPTPLTRVDKRILTPFLKVSGFFFSARVTPLALLMATIVLIPLGILSHRQSWRWQNTFTLYSYTAQTQPHSWRAQNLIGVALLEARKTEQAEPHFIRAMELDSVDNSPLPYANLGIVRLQQGRPQEAITLLETATRRSPRFATAWLNLAEAYLRADRLADAERAAQVAVERAPDDPNAARVLKEARWRLGKR